MLAFVEIEAGFAGVGQEGGQFEAAVRGNGHVIDGTLENLAADAAMEKVGFVGGAFAEEADLFRPDGHEHLAADPGAVAASDPEVETALEPAEEESVFALKNLGFDDVGLADEAGHEFGARMMVNLGRRADLFDFAFVHHRDAIGHAEGFLLVVCDKDERDAQALLQVFQFGAHLGAQLGIEGGKRFVQEQNLGLANNGPREGDALALSTGQLRRLAVLHALQRGHGHGPLGLFADGLGRHFFHAQPESDVLAHGEMREEGVALENLVDVALVGRVVGNVMPTDENLTAARLLEAADEAQAGRLAATGRPEEGHELTLGDVEADVIEGEKVTESLGDIADFDHGLHWGSGDQMFLNHPIRPGAMLILICFTSV